MFLAVTLLAALLTGVGFVLQQRAAEEVPKTHFLHLRLILELLRKPRWLAGMAAMVGGELLSAWGVGHVNLSLAEPLLTSSMLFALILAVPLSGEPLRRSEIVGALLLGAGVTVLSLAQTVQTGPVLRFGSPGYWWTAAVIAVIAAGFVQLGRRAAGDQRAIWTGAGCGLLFGISDALTRTTVQTLDGAHILSLLTSWPAYSMAAASVIGIWLMESAFNAGPLHASLPAITAGEPIAGMALGVVVFGDKVPVSPAWLGLQAAGLAAMIIGVVVVARAPRFADLRRVVPHHHRDSRAQPPPAAPEAARAKAAPSAAQGRRLAAHRPGPEAGSGR